MAIKSMTGFGTGDAGAGELRVVVELSSVNRKQLEVVVRVPSHLASFESRLQKIVQEYLSRGRVSGSILVESPAGETTVEVDTERAAAVIKKLRASAQELNLADDLTAGMLLEIPGLLSFPAQQQDPEEVFPVFEEALRSALKNLVAMRAEEGNALAADFKTRLKWLDAMLDQIKELAPEVVSKHRKKLLNGLASLGFDHLDEDERVLKEIALFGEKCDIAEEITRLDSHIAQFEKLLLSSDPSGRALDFLIQEFGREINTIGSKAHELKITEQVVAFKAELERIREQVQNVE